jgi:general secretion pathway protein D
MGSLPFQLARRAARLNGGLFFVAFPLVLAMLGHPVAAGSLEEAPGGRPAIAGEACTGVADMQYVQIDFEDVDILVFIKAMSEITGKNFVVSPKVKGKVNMVAPREVPVGEAYQIFQSVLEVHGFTTVPTGGIVKIVPSAEARGKAVDTPSVR